MSSLFSAGNAALSDYMGVGYGGIATDPSQLQAMNGAQMAEYQRRQGDPRNAAFLNTNGLEAMRYGNYRPPAPKPTMTLAEWDARRAAFNP